MLKTSVQNLYMQKNQEQDQNFDNRNTTFKKNIYGSSKGKVREAILQRDLTEYIASLPNQHDPIKVLDVGGGQGQLACYLATLGCDVTLTDVSIEMLEVAQTRVKDMSLTNVAIAQKSLQQCARDYVGAFDIVLCHAVFEWLEDPALGYKQLMSLIKPQGAVSFMYYNEIGQTLSNLVYGNFEYIKDGMKGRKVVKLNPQSSLHPETVRGWVAKGGHKILFQSGVRCFHDYMRDITKWDDDLAGIIEMELNYSRQIPYNEIGRYTHLLIEAEQLT